MNYDCKEADRGDKQLHKIIILMICSLNTQHIRISVSANLTLSRVKGTQLFTAALHIERVKNKICKGPQNVLTFKA